MVWTSVTWWQIQQNKKQIQIQNTTALQPVPMVWTSESWWQWPGEFPTHLRRSHSTMMMISTIILMKRVMIKIVIAMMVMMIAIMNRMSAMVMVMIQYHHHRGNLPHTHMNKRCDTFCSKDQDFHLVLFLRSHTDYIWSHTMLLAPVSKTPTYVWLFSGKHQIFLSPSDDMIPKTNLLQHCIVR